jgi:hypothetical protein
VARRKQIKALAPSTTTVELAEQLAVRVKEVLGVEDFTPFEVLAVAAADPLNDASLRVKAASELARYYRPQVRALAVETHATSDVNITISDFASSRGGVSLLPEPAPKQSIEDVSDDE